jgi:hypothetical protein
MALVVKDRVRESSATSGTGTITLSGAYVGFQTFSSAIADSSTVFYCIHNTSPGVETEWEVGYGTYSANTLTRDTLYSSSTGSTVSFSAGTKEVFITYPSEAAVYEDNDGNVTVEGKITVGAAPTADLDVATKLYVDSLVASGIHFHAPVRLEHVGNLPGTYDNGTAGVGATLTNNSTQVALTADGVAVDNGDRILFYEQTDATQNGVYVVTDKGSVSTNWVLTRATDADSFGLTSPNNLGEGSTFFVQAGNTASGETYTCNTVGTITFGTTNITFAQVSAAAVYSGATPIDVTGTEISLTTVPATLGGTGISSYTLGEVVYASGTTTLAQLAGNTTTTAKYLTQTGTGSASAAPTWTALAASATTDTTNASNISSGTLASARISGSYTGITGVGTLTAGTWNASTVGAAYGGTGLTSYAVGDIVYASGSTTLSKLAGVATGNVLISGGVTTAPSYGKVGLTTHVSGILPIANGGTGQSTASGAINALVPSQTGNSGEYLTTNGSVVSWAAVPSPNNGTLTMAVSGTGLSGSASFTADQAGSSSFTVTSNATSANTGSAIVARDGSGNFSAGTITAALSGNATTATTASATTATLTRGSYLTGSNFNGSSATTWAVDAATANTASKIVARDASGNFSAGTITAALSGNASTATTLQTARNIGGVSFNGSADINLPGVNTTGNQNTSGNASTATTLQTARTINGTSFNGSANITVPANIATSATASAFKVPFANTTASTTGNYALLQDSTATFTYNPSTNTLVAGTFSGALSGNATTATTLQTARTINGTSFNGSANITITANTTNTLTRGSYLTGSNFTGSAATTWAVDATSANTASKVVARDGSGNFSAGTITATLSGNATSATSATTAGSCTGNAATATTLQTARTINGVSFNGSANITITAAATNVNTQLASLGVGTAASGTAGEIRATNNITAYYSDDRLKTKLGDIDNALDKIDTLAGFYYEANQTAQDLGYDVIREVGISAQSVQAVMPEVVAPAPIDDKYLTVRYERLVPLLIQGIKELRAEVKALKGE